mgnify:CR=1 FL=1
MDGKCKIGAVQEEDYEVEYIDDEAEVIDRRVKGGKRVSYFVKWKGWPARYNTWEPLSHLQNLQAEIAAFESGRNK